MKKYILVIVPFIFFMGLMTLHSCKSGSDESAIASDSVSLALGKELFENNCSACHNFRQDGIGPKLSGVTADASVDWIKHFVQDPEAMIKSGDERAKKLFDRYHSMMPPFKKFTEQDLDHIIAYLHVHKSNGAKVEDKDDKSIKDPVPQPIAQSGLVAELEEVTRIPASSKESPLTRIAKFDLQPNTSNIFIMDLRGKLYKLENNQPVLYMDMAKLQPAFINEPGLATGFGSFAFHPEFAKNGLLYTTHTEPSRNKKADFTFDDTIKSKLQWVLTEWKTDRPDGVPFSGKGRELLRIEMVSAIHGVQEVTFNPLSKPGADDYGQLYIGVGDGGAVENGAPFLAHDLSKIWGTIIRIDPRGNNSANGQYGISTHNPFYKTVDPKNLREIYAYGFRNPHRITWTKAGQMLATNIGQGNIEAVNLIEPGHDYGWPIREGTFLMNIAGEMTKVYALPADDSTYHITYPVAQYDHGEGNAISGGYEYWGTAVPQLGGKYFFGDIVNGRLFYINLADIKAGSQAPIKEWQVSFKGKQVSLRELCGIGRVDLRFGRDRQGELYILTKSDGKVYKITSAKSSNP